MASRIDLAAEIAYHTATGRLAHKLSSPEAARL
jgi:hypothetical protein